MPTNAADFSRAHETTRADDSYLVLFRALGTINAAQCEKGHTQASPAHITLHSMAAAVKSFFLQQEGRERKRRRVDQGEAKL